jgi:23S rRNA pseudouridine2604 synthase
MTEMPRKPLGLPPRAPSDEAPANTDRRPVRGGASKRKTAAELAQTNAAYAAKARALQEKPRGTPSRAPVVPKLPLMVRKSPVAPATEKGAVQSGVRISKLMAERGLCSRRDADGYIERGWVFVDGLRVTELGTRADPAVKITLAREAQIQQTWQMTILLHKPVGYVSGQPEPGFTPAVTLIQPENQFSTADTPAFHPRHLKGLAPAGRLDIDSTGLLVLTQDGRVARQLIGEDSQVDKEYLVRVEGRLNAAGLALLNHGLSLDGKQLKPAKVEWLNEDQLRFVLREGRKRQIRRMCELVGLHVVGLKRVRIGGIKLGDLPLGQWRFLREDEGF